MYTVGGLLSHRSGKTHSFTTLEDKLVLVDERNAWLDQAPMPVARHSTVSTVHGEHRALHPTLSLTEHFIAGPYSVHGTCAH